jgi:uncharacterized protein YkwD
MGSRIRFASVCLRLAFVAAAVLLVVTHLPVATVSAAGDCTLSPAEYNLDTEEKAFLTLINNHRAANGRAPLTVSYLLTRSSAWKSKHMGQYNYFAHDDTPIGRSWSQRTVDCGYTYGTWLGENIAAGYVTAAAVFEGWKNSPGHNSNMLSTNFTAIGIGRHNYAGSTYGWYWTTVFGGVNDGWSSTGPETITAIGGMEPLNARRATGQAVLLAPASARSADAPRSGSLKRALDFTRVCQTLTERRHPLAKLFCSVS